MTRGLWEEIDMPDSGWFDPRQPEQTPVEQTSVMPVLALALPAQRTADALTCPENTSCAQCGRPLYEGFRVRPAHDTREVPYECLVCWWQAELDRVRAMLP